MFKINKPCFFFNTGGCFFSNGQVRPESHCKYRHIHVSSPIQKPQFYKFPCKYFHLSRQCKKFNCNFGHIELSPARWLKYFPDNKYPGKNYVTKFHHKWYSKNPNKNWINKDLNCLIILKTRI